MGLNRQTSKYGPCSLLLKVLSLLEGSLEDFIYTKQTERFTANKSHLICVACLEA